MEGVSGRRGAGIRVEFDEEGPKDSSDIAASSSCLYPHGFVHIFLFLGAIFCHLGFGYLVTIFRGLIDKLKLFYPFTS